MASGCATLAFATLSPPCLGALARFEFSGHITATAGIGSASVGQPIAGSVEFDTEARPTIVHMLGEWWLGEAPYAAAYFGSRANRFSVAGVDLALDALQVVVDERRGADHVRLDFPLDPAWGAKPFNEVYATILLTDAQGSAFAGLPDHMPWLTALTAFESQVGVLSYNVRVPGQPMVHREGSFTLDTWSLVALPSPDPGPAPVPEPGQALLSALALAVALASHAWRRLRSAAVPVAGPRATGGMSAARQGVVRRWNDSPGPAQIPGCPSRQPPAVRHAPQGGSSGAATS